MGETMNKILIAATALLIMGAIGAAQQTNQQQTQDSQFQPGNVFENENTRLNAVYAVDQEGDFYGLLFSNNQAYFFGTVDSFNALQGDNIEVCQHYLTQRRGFLGDIFGNERTVSEVNCVPLQGNIQGQVPVQPRQNQPNQSNLDRQSGQGLFQQQNQTQQPGQGLFQTQNQSNQTQQQRQMEYPDIFYAYDADGDYITYVINNQGEISNVVGSVQDINQLNQDSLIGCEYFFQAGAIAQAQDPSEINCYGYEELQNMSQQGQIPYLDLDMQQTQENQSQGDGIFGGLGNQSNNQPENQMR